MTTTTPATTPAGLSSEAPRRPATARWPLGRRTRRALLLLHVLSSVGWFGAAGAVVFLLLAAFGRDTATGLVLYDAVRTLLWLTVPTGLVALVTGLLLGVGTKWGVLLHWWVLLKLVFATAVLVTDVLVVRTAIDAALAAGEVDGRALGSTVAHCVLLAVATWLSIAKPRRLTALGRRAAAGARRGP